MTDYDRFGSNHSVAEKLQATVVEETPESYFVQYGDDDFDVEPKSEKNRILFETELVDADDPTIVAEGHTGPLASSERVRFEADLEANVYTLEAWDEAVELSGDDLVYALDLVIDDIESDGDGRATSEVDVNVGSSSQPFDAHTGTTNSITFGESDDCPDDEDEVHILSEDVVEKLYQRYKHVVADRVRQDVVSDFLRRYDAWVDVTDDGWVIDGAFLVTYDAENYVIEDVEAHEVHGQGTKPIGDRQEFLDIEFDLSRERAVELGREQVDLTEREQEFLALVEVLCFPEDHLGTKLTNRVEEARHGGGFDEIAEIADTNSVSSFMDPQSGLVHQHDIDKHTLQASFSVTAEVIADLHFTEYDHAGVHELVYRERELRNADYSVFWDTDNDDDGRWEQIRNAADSAPVPDGVHRELRERYGPCSY